MRRCDSPVKRTPGILNHDLDHLNEGDREAFQTWLPRMRSYKQSLSDVTDVAMDHRCAQTTEALNDGMIAVSKTVTTAVDISQ